MGIVYYTWLFCLPDLIMKLKGYDPMKRKFDADMGSYRIKNEIVDKKQMEKPF